MSFSKFFNPRTTAFGRDVRPAHYKPGTLGTPREGPNPRELSNAFFKNRKTTTWDHTPFLPGFVEFLVHDLMFSQSGHEEGDKYDIPIPKGDEFFDPEGTGKKKFVFWRSKKMPGTGENGIEREILNVRSNWMDLETVYGTNYVENEKLRVKDKDGTVRCELILDREGYLPMNDERFDKFFKMTGYGVQKDLFVAGDPRANQDLVRKFFFIITSKKK